MVYTFDTDKAAQLYSEGKCDMDIALALGVEKRKICDWRNKMGLPFNKNGKQGPRETLHKKKSRLAIDAEEATKRGMTYGMYKALQMQGGI